MFILLGFWICDSIIITQKSIHLISKQYQTMCKNFQKKLHVMSIFETVILKSLMMTKVIIHFRGDSKYEYIDPHYRNSPKIIYSTYRHIFVIYNKKNRNQFNQHGWQRKLINVQQSIFKQPAYRSIFQRVRRQVQQQAGVLQLPRMWRRSLLTTLRQLNYLLPQRSYGWKEEDVTDYNDPYHSHTTVSKLLLKKVAMAPVYFIELCINVFSSFE